MKSLSCSIRREWPFGHWMGHPWLPALPLGGGSALPRICHSSCDTVRGGKAHQATLHTQPRSRKKQRGASFSEEGSHITTHLSTSFSNRSSARLATKGSGWRWLACWGSSRCWPTTNTPVSHSSSSSAFWSFCKQWSDTSWEHNHVCLPRVCL